MNAFFYYNGIKQLAGEISGREHIYLGIRPYGFHAGNMLPLIVYPLLLAKELEKMGKEPRFTIFVFINDWEQDRLAGPHVKVYPFNVFPENTTFQYMLDPDNPKVNIVDYWEPVILSGVKLIRKLYPKITVKGIRNSEMKNHPLMKKYLLYTLKNPQAIARVFRKLTRKIILDDPLSFALAVCPGCDQVRGKTVIQTRHHGESIIRHKCINCGKVSHGRYEDFDYWFYHKPLAVPRLEICGIDICITGADHFREGDFEIRNELINTFRSQAKLPKTLYTPVLLGTNGEVMGKSRGNTRSLSPEHLIRLVMQNPNSPTIRIS